ncbi:MAG: FAD-dependent oxidoreductase [Oscillatoriaceae bacterium SKW80]|nr:FAD-dependent oxidoreductase [Oscillatoriaceae bacterium SKYG93]MCX8120458.1 FAD-dependent oxidoreductase [Oscillatoriaceae bacterium SKW80]MDW8452967.1 FAD-dependent oxidoreductase [Oscillatoriaceae cyanobacterium SKYGB_i_bin93]HIK28564.1 FAD-dependent oxidoreductase [Oscillatoriaceae cyanobacterium M7585_C2015_266]
MQGQACSLAKLSQLTTDVLVVGGGTGGTCAAIQAARRGAKTILVSEFPWLGGMLTSAGVCAPDGNEPAAFQTGIWGAFLQELQLRQPGGLDNAWVSFFTYDPRIGAQIFADWVRQIPSLKWIIGQVPLEVFRQGNRITGVRFTDFIVHAHLTLDATELGDVLALAEVPYRWGWEFQSEWNEPSAPVAANILTEKYPVQAPTWVFIMRDFGANAIAPEIPPPPSYNPERFIGAWDKYGTQQFLNYGRLPNGYFMINWPIRGNDYGEGVARLIQSQATRQEFLQEALWHSQSFARFIQTHLERRYGLAEDIFPLSVSNTLGGGAYALHLYYRESRRVRGLTTIREQDILPLPGGRVACLPLDNNGQVSAIAIGNYLNDHHYPIEKTELFLNLHQKSIRWGGRLTGTAFTIPYSSLIPAEIDGLLVCEKNISVSHIANGATRLQPVVMGIGQAAGMAAALCVARNCQPRDLPVRILQEALLQDPQCPAAIIPLFNLTSDRSDWLYWQRYYLDHPDLYPSNGDCPLPENNRFYFANSTPAKSSSFSIFSGIFQRHGDQDYSLQITHPYTLAHQTWTLVTLRPEVDQQLKILQTNQAIAVEGRLNPSGNWILVERICQKLHI